jgi:hypothetical protein
VGALAVQNWILPFLRSSSKGPYWSRVWYEEFLRVGYTHSSTLTSRGRSVDGIAPRTCSEPLKLNALPIRPVVTLGETGVVPL